MNKNMELMEEIDYDDEFDLVFHEEGDIDDEADIDYEAIEAIEDIMLRKIAEVIFDNLPKGFNDGKPLGQVKGRLYFDVRLTVDRIVNYLKLVQSWYNLDEFIPEWKEYNYSLDLVVIEEIRKEIERKRKFGYYD